MACKNTFVMQLKWTSEIICKAYLKENMLHNSNQNKCKNAASSELNASLGGPLDLHIKQRCTALIDWGAARHASEPMLVLTNSWIK